MQTLITALCLLALAGCSVFDEVVPPERVVGPFYVDGQGNELPGPMYIHYGPTFIKCSGSRACASVYLDDYGRPVKDEPCVIHMLYIERFMRKPHEERHCLKGILPFHDYGKIGFPDYWLKEQ